ncbi:MAG: MAPEG family protein [Rhodospirillaceae bacterium]|nr:MAPEG family protein [Rhodospirillaceae bacterium]
MTVPIFYPGLATLLAIVLYLCIWFRVGQMRREHGIVAPAVTGHPAFERAYRVQMNTVEQLVAFLPMLWLFAVLIDGEWAGGLGLLWVAGRIHYAVSYSRDPKTRAPGMIVSIAVTILLTLGVAWGLIVLAL